MTTLAATRASTATRTRLEIIHAYRHLYQQGLRTVQFSAPARYVIRDRLRAAFRRNAPPAEFHPARIARTLEFLGNAERYVSLEHKIVKNLVHVWWARKTLEDAPIRPSDYTLRSEAYVQFDQTLARLDETMGMCLS